MNDDSPSSTNEADERGGEGDERTMEEEHRQRGEGEERGGDSATATETTATPGTTGTFTMDESENPHGVFPLSAESPGSQGRWEREEEGTTPHPRSGDSSSSEVDDPPLTDDNAEVRRELWRQRQSTVSPRLLSLAAGTGVDEESYSASFPYCQKAKALLASLKRTDWLPPYDEEGVRKVTEECRALFRFIEDLNPNVEDLAGLPELSSTLIILHQCILRNKRCLMAYASYRLDKVEALVWELGMKSEIPAEYASKLSRREVEHYHAYKNLVGEYQVACGVELLTNTQPPKELFVEVRALKDMGEIVLESGQTVVFNKHSTHYLRRSDVELLIKQDALVQID